MTEPNTLNHNQNHQTKKSKNKCSTFYNCGRYTIQITKWFGFFPFYTTTEATSSNKVSSIYPQQPADIPQTKTIDFKWISFTSVFHIFITILSILISRYASNQYFSFIQWASHGVVISATESMVYTIISSTIAGGRICLQLESFAKAKKYTTFWKELDLLLDKIITICKCNPEGKYSASVEKYLKTFYKIETHLPIKLFLLIMINSITLLYFNLPLFIEFFDGALLVFISAGAIASWNIISIGFLFNAIYMSFVIGTFKLCFQLVRDQIEEIRIRNSLIFTCKTSSNTNKVESSPESKQCVTRHNEKIIQLIELYNSIENIVETFNNLFGIKLFIYVATLLVIFVVNVFFTISHAFESETTQAGYIRLLISVPVLLIYLIGIMVLCSRGDNMTKEATKCLRLFQPIISAESFNGQTFTPPFWKPPSISASNYFDVNKRLLLNIIGTISTYLVILVQFRVGDNQGRLRSDYNSTTR